MLERDRVFLAKFAVDTEVDFSFDGYDELDHFSDNALDADDIGLDELDEDFFTDY